MNLNAGVSVPLTNDKQVKLYHLVPLEISASPTAHVWVGQQRKMSTSLVRMTHRLELLDMKIAN